MTEKEIYLERKLAMAELHHKWFQILILKFKLWRLRNARNNKIDDK